MELLGIYIINSHQVALSTSDVGSIQNDENLIKKTLCTQPFFYICHFEEEKCAIWSSCSCRFSPEKIPRERDQEARHFD